MVVSKRTRHRRVQRRVQHGGKLNNYAFLEEANNKTEEYKTYITDLLKNIEAQNHSTDLDLYNNPEDKKLEYKLFYYLLNDNTINATQFKIKHKDKNNNKILEFITTEITYVIYLLIISYIFINKWSFYIHSPTTSCFYFRS